MKSSCALSVVATLYRSAPFLEEFCRRSGAIAQRIYGDDYEIVLVNDGSPDHSLPLAIQLQSRDAHLQVVDLSRNFGHHAAIVAGLRQSRGEHVFLIDCDLEEQPEWLELFFIKMKESHPDVVYGVQQKRVSSLLSNFLGETFWYAINLLSSVGLPHNPMTCRLMTRRYVNSVLTVGDKALYLAGVFSWAGYHQVSIPLVKTRRPRAHPSTYNLSRKLMHVADSFLSFNVVPLVVMFFSGLLVWVGSLMYALCLLVQKLLHPDMILSGFTSLMLSLWFFGGTIILFIGTLGLYLAKIFQEVKRRPLYIVRNTYGENHCDRPD